MAGKSLAGTILVLHHDGHDQDVQIADMPGASLEDAFAAPAQAAFVDVGGSGRRYFKCRDSAPRGFKLLVCETKLFQAAGLGASTTSALAKRCKQLALQSRRQSAEF